MRLTFSILWFDDSEDYFDSLDVEPLEQEIFSWGFRPNIIMATTSEEFLNHRPFEKLDLIVVDRNLEDYPNGEEFISDLRNHAVYTEVIFYTALNISDLWNAVREKQLEGVFVSSRNDIFSKIFRVGRQSISKVLDLENVRGIVMAEVGELDHLLDEIITIGISDLPEELKSSIFNRFYEGVAEQNREDGNRIAAFNANPEMSEMLALCDSNKRWQNFNRLWGHHEKLRGKDRIGNYDTDVLQPRNYLAHGRPELQADGCYIFSYRGREYRFDNATSLSLRQTILRYKAEFSDILTILMSGS